MSTPNTANILLGLDLAAALAARVLALVQAASTAAAAGRDLTADELQRFVEADDLARDRLQAKIDAARAREAGGHGPA
jgi:hypothetical protein